MKRSTILNQALQKLDDWQENSNCTMGPEVPLKKLKATRAQFDTCIMDVQATNRTLTKQVDDRDDLPSSATSTRCGPKAIQRYFGPDSTQYAQVGGTRQTDRKNGGRRAKVAGLPKVAQDGTTIAETLTSSDQGDAALSPDSAQ